ncbi:MAG TPA: hypothetical protein VFD58_13550 [Blastocatellia bacterium]|nr:hypothetical protein [Blastocatellia bacterium]
MDQLKGILTNSNLFTQNGVPITNALTSVNARKNADALNGNGTFTVTYTLSPNGNPTVISRPANSTINGAVWVTPPPQAIVMNYAYEIVATGTNDVSNSNPFRAQAKASERGFITLTLNPTIAGGTVSYRRSFSQYGAFFDRFTGSLASGTFRGPFHTNQQLGISTSGSVIFKDKVTQSGGNTYNYGSGTKTVNNTDWPGVDYQSTFTTAPTVPLPDNVYSQPYAVLNKTGLHSGSNYEPTATELTTGTTKVLGANKAVPAVSGGTIANGVYLPSSDNMNITGGGIYVKGSAEVELSVTSGGAQVYKITQGTITTEITVTGTDSSGSTTVVRKNGSTVTSTESYTGVPMDATDPTQPAKQGVSLYVSGDITSLHGPAGVGSGSSRTTAPAIASQTRVTVTALSDITVTGDLKYQDPTVDPLTGLPTANADQKTNILGIFTNSGMVNLNPSSTYTTQNYSLTIDAAIATFDEAALNSNSSLNTGGIYYNGPTLNSNSRLLIRGSRIQSKILSIGYGGGSSGTRDVFFDERFRDGVVAPPFFPTTLLQDPPVPFSLALSTSGVASQSNTWQRTN